MGPVRGLLYGWCVAAVAGAWSLPTPAQCPLRVILKCTGTDAIGCGWDWSLVIHRHSICHFTMFYNVNANIKCRKNSSLTVVCIPQAAWDLITPAGSSSKLIPKYTPSSRPCLIFENNCTIYGFYVLIVALQKFCNRESKNGWGPSGVHGRNPLGDLRSERCVYAIRYD